MNPVTQFIVAWIFSIGKQFLKNKSSFFIIQCIDPASASTTGPTPRMGAFLFKLVEFNVKSDKAKK